MQEYLCNFIRFYIQQYILLFYSSYTDAIFNYIFRIMNNKTETVIFFIDTRKDLSIIKANITVLLHFYLNYCDLFR